MKAMWTQSILHSLCIVLAYGYKSRQIQWNELNCIAFFCEWVFFITVRSHRFAEIMVWDIAKNNFLRHSWKYRGAVWAINFAINVGKYMFLSYVWSTLLQKHFHGLEWRCRVFWTEHWTPQISQRYFWYFTFISGPYSIIYIFDHILYSVSGEKQVNKHNHE